MQCTWNAQQKAYYLSVCVRFGVVSATSAVIDALGKFFCIFSAYWMLSCETTIIKANQTSTVCSCALPHRIPLGCVYVCLCVYDGVLGNAAQPHLPVGWYWRKCNDAKTTTNEKKEETRHRIKIVNMYQWMNMYGSDDVCVRISVHFISLFGFVSFCLT